MAKDDFKVKKGLVVGKGIVADSDVTANAFIGDGSQLTNLDYSNISSNLPNILDSGNVSALIDSADTHDSAAVLGQITSTVDSDYIELRRPAESIFNVVNSGGGSSAYAYTGDGFISSTDNPPLYLTRGKTYKFSVNASGHPFWIKTSDTTGTGNQYNDGVTNNGAQVGDIIFTVPMDAPTVLYYICQSHGNMKNTIYIDKVVGVDSAAVSALIDSADTHDSAAVLGQINDTVTISYINTLSGTLDADTLGGRDSNYFTNASNIISGTLDSGHIPFLSTTDITSGTFDSARIPVLSTSDITSGTFDSTRIPTLVLGTDTNGNYVQSTTAGLGIKSLSAAGEGVDQTIAVDSGFVTGLFTGGDGISYSGGTIALDPTDSATFANVTATNEIRIKDSANGSEVAHLSGDPNLGLVIHSHAHATDGGIRFVIHDTADSDFLVINRTNGISFENRRARNLADPTADQDAATKAYVDAVAEGLHVHAPTRAATVGTLASITGVTSVAYGSGTAGVGSFLAITGSLDSIDGVALASDDRLLIKNETNQAFNGIYVWDSATRITRALDFDTPAELAGGDFVFNQEGTVNADAGFVQTETLSSIGDSAVIFVQFSGAGQITAGDGLSKTGNVLDVTTGAGLTIVGDKVRIGEEALDTYFFDMGTSTTALGRQVGIANIFLETNETLDNLTAHEGATYKFYTTARGDSDTRALVDSDYVRFRVDSDYVKSIADSDYVKSIVDSDYVRFRVDSDYIKSIADSDYVKSIADSDYIKTVTSFPSTNLDNSSVTVTAGKGLLNGGAVSLGGTITIDLDSANIQRFTLDSGEVSALIDSALTVFDAHDSAAVQGQFDSAILTTSIGTLSDVNLTGITHNYILKYDSDTGVFTAQVDGGAGAGAGASSSFTIALNLLDSTGRAGTDIPSALGVGDPVYYDSDAGYWTGAKADSAATASHVIVEYSTSNSNFKIAQTGVFTLDSNSASPTFSDNSYYYLSDSSGVPTATTPLTGIFQALYYALDSDTIDINLGDPVEIGVGTTDVEQFPTVTGGATILTLTQAINTARTDVFKNGVLLRQGASQDYTINSPTQINMVDALDDSDLISVRSTVLGTTLNTATTVIDGTSASSPGPSVLGDANTGLFSDASDTLSIVTGGSERLKVTNSGIETTSGISGDLTLNSGVGIPNNKGFGTIGASDIRFNIDSGNTGTVTFNTNQNLVVGTTGNAALTPYIGTAFTILAFNNDVNSDRTLTVQADTGDTLHFSSTNVVTVSSQKMAIISGMVFDADDLVISSISLDSSLTF